MKKTRYYLLLPLLFLAMPSIHAQIGGNGAYKFLTLPASARIAAMGGNFLAASDHDINLALANPSLITPQMHNNLALNFVDYFSDINYGFVSYGRSFDKLGSFVGSVQYIDYGRFTYADDIGEASGNFNAGETALVMGWGRNLDSTFSIGANLKTIFSALETYNSFGLAVDVAGSYHTSDGFTASFIAKNIGRQLTTYTPGNPEPLPFELQLGISKKLQHMPFRYSILLTNLQKWDLTYNDPSKIKVDPFTGIPVKEDKFSELLDKTMRHVVIGGEFVPTKSLSIRFGYNYRLRQEMKVDSKVSTVGFSWGIGIRVSKFQFNYARRAYHLEGSPNFISVATNLSDLF
ncbi:MAG: type IX secretion system protein PorQ [Bacteroidales bacterium]|nr:type IX secretion system protein PorQ [Bacteroidales bacterium]MDZ4203701.1 type IX secretion system protein PorQ [Bacteroidales bacterium]